MMTQPVATPPPEARESTDLTQILATLVAYPALVRALVEPAATKQDKITLIDQVFADCGQPARQRLAGLADQNWASTNAVTTWVQTQAALANWRWAQLTGELHQVIDQVFEFGQLLRRDHPFRAAVTNPSVATGTRQELVRSAVGSSMSAPALQLALLAVGFVRGTVDAALKQFIDLGVELAGSQLAVVTVAQPLPSDQKERLRLALEQRQGSRIIIEEVVDPTVLGGVRVECGSHVMDGTMSARLQSAQRAFA